MSATKISAFWDSSALVPLCASQTFWTMQARTLDKQFKDRIAWWGASIEIHAALQRLYREQVLDSAQLAKARARCEMLISTLNFINPSERVREMAMTFPALYELRALDALQLAAALVWCNEKPRRRPFVCFDKRLAEAARKAGFTIHTS